MIHHKIQLIFIVKNRNSNTILFDKQKNLWYVKDNTNEMCFYFEKKEDEKMAQVEKNENFKELKTKEEQRAKTNKKGKKEEPKKKTKKHEEANLKDKAVNFAHGVQTETKRIHWPTKKEMIKYSVATIAFIIFFAVFFFIIDVIFAFVHSLIG